MKTAPVFLMLTAALACTSAIAKPLKVFILAGQSNMEGHAGVQTFDHIGMDPKTAPILKDMRNPDGTPRVCEDVHIALFTSTGGWGKEPKPVKRQGKLTVGFGAQNGEKIGPEFTFGIYINKLLNEPVLIIKTAWGNKSLHTDFRSPSAGPYEWNEAVAAGITDEKKEAKRQATGHYYRLMLQHVKEVLADPASFHPAYNAKDGYELAGFVWFQGFNDMVARETYPDRNKPGGYDLYTELLVHFIRDVRKDLDAPNMPFVIGVMGIGGPSTAETEAARAPRYRGITPNFRSAMAAPAKMPEFKDTVAAVLTENYWDAQLAELADREWKTVGARMKKEAEGRKLSREEHAALREKIMSETYTPEERKILATGKSNKGYHYLGSSKIMAQIGKGFAEAMARLHDENAE